MRKLRSQASTLVEIVIVVSILAIGIVSVFALVNSGSILARTTEDRIRAINLAREWIEIVTNIRDTNWVRFSSDSKNCFDVKDYDSTCVWWSLGPSGKLASINDYIPIKWAGNTWYLTGTTLYGSGVGFDANGEVVQGSDLSPYASTPCIQWAHTACKTHNFFRTIRISNWPTVNGLSSLQVQTIVTWIDTSSKSKPYTITFDKTLTNWKQNFEGN